MTAAEMAALAEGLAGTLSPAQRDLLPGLCRAAEAALRQSLRADATGYEEALGYAAAWTALGQLRAVSGEPERFTAGDFSVTRGSADALEQKALALLAPYLAEGFAFRRV